VSAHKTAVVGKNASIGKGTVVWAFAQIGDKAKIGSNCVLGNGCYVDRTCVVGNRVKIMNKAQVFRGCAVGNNVFIGPGAVVANDRSPRVEKTRQFTKPLWRIGEHASIGANSTVLPDVNIGEHAMVGAGSVVTKDVPKHGLVYGNPAKLHGFVCFCGEKLRLERHEGRYCVLKCGECGESVKVESVEYEKIEK
jgi:acetyltransferase-like isoleucine patch superfamily enzyme